MATEADISEGPEPILVAKMKEETNELNCSHLDTMVSKASSLGELRKVGNEYCLLTSETVEKSMNTEDKDEVSQNFNDNINNHILEEKVESTEGETFFKSTAIANGASHQNIQGSEICENREKLALVQKEDVVANKDVKETHDITSMNNIVAFDKHGTSMTLENAKFEEEEKIAHSSKLPSEVNTTDICTAENYMSIPNITSTSLDQSVQEEKIEVREVEIIKEEEKHTSEEISGDRRTLVEEIDKEEIWQHQHVESSTAEAYEEMSPVTEEVATVSQKDETEVSSFELGEQVGQTVETTPDHNESVKKMEVSKDESTGLVTLTNGQDKEKTCDSDNITIKQDVFNDDVTQTKEQEEKIMFSAEPEEKEKLECASSQALKDIKDAEKPCQEEVAIGQETDDINEYTDKQIIREDVATKYQSCIASFGEDMVQSSQADEEVEMKQDAEVSMGIEVDKSTKNPAEKVIAEKEAIEDHCEASTGAEIVQKENQEEEKEANKPEEEDSAGTQTTITVEDIHEVTFENNDVVNDYCIESDSGKSRTKSSQEDLEVTEELEVDEAKKNIVERIIQEIEAVENYREPSIGEETIKKANQEDENKAKEYIKEDCSGTQTITAYEDTQEHAFDNNAANNDNCTDSQGEQIVNIEENSGEDLERKLLKVEVFGGLETNASTTASENTSKQIFKDDVVMSLLPVSIDEETTKAIHTQDEAHEKIEGAGDGMTTAEHNVQEDVIATDLPAISLLEKIIRNGCQEDEACNKEPERRGGNDDAVNEYVEANGVTIAIGEGTTAQDSHEEENNAKSKGKGKECDMKPKGLNLDNEKEPNSNPIGCVNTKVSGEEIQREWNEKPVDYPLVSEVDGEQIKKEIAEENESIDDELKTNVSNVNQNMSFNADEPEGVKLINTSDVPSVTSHVPIEANEDILETLHVEDLNLGENSRLDKKAGNEILEKENAYENRARDEIKYYMTHGASNAIVPEYVEDGVEPILGTEAATVMILPVIESEMLQETSVLSSEKLNPESTEADMTSKDDTPTEDRIQEGVQNTPIERTKEEEKEASIEETINMQEKELETTQPRQIINNEHTVEGEILKPRVEEVLKQSLNVSEVDKQERCADLMSKGIDTVDSSANGDKDTSDKVEGGEENLKESIKEDIQNGESSGIDHTGNMTALQGENLQTADSCEMFQNKETDTLWKDEDDASVFILKPKEDDHKEAQNIEATEEIKSTKNGALHYNKADGLVESVERECGKLELIDLVEKLRVVSETTAGDRNSTNSTETEREGQIVMDQQNTGSGENRLVVQNTREENTEAEKFGETRPNLKPEETDPQVHSEAVTVIQEFRRAEKSEEIEKQMTGKDVAARLYVVSTSDEAIKKVQDTDITGNEQNIDAKESNEKKEITTLQDEENPNSKPDVASMTEEPEVEKPNKVVDNELPKTFTLISEVLEENNQETTEDLPDMTNTESALVVTKERSSQPVELEYEKIMLPAGICSEEKTLEPVETIEPINSTEDGNVTQDKSIEDKLGGNKFEKEIKEVVPAADALSGSEDEREEATSRVDNVAEKTEENLQEYYALMSETQDVGTLKDNPTIMDASKVEHNPEVEVESIVCQNVEADKKNAHDTQVTAVDEVIKDEAQMEDETQDKNVDTHIAPEITVGIHPPKEEECKELKTSPVEFEDVNKTLNVDPMKEAGKLDLSPACDLEENVSERTTGSVLEWKELTELTEPVENCEDNLKEGTSESGAWKKKSENNELEECFLKVEEETETLGASEDPHKDVIDNNVQVKNHEEQSTEYCKDDASMRAKPNEENSEILVNLGEKIGSLEVKSTIHNDDNSSKMNSSVEEKLVGEVGGECIEASNPEKSREYVSEAQTRDMLLKTKMTENDEDGKDIVPVGDGNIGEISLVETTRKEQLMEETHIRENEENEYLKTESAQEVCERLENSDTSESSEKQIQSEEGFVEKPCPISVGKDTVTESHQEAHARDPFKLEPVELGNDPIADQITKTNEATEIIKNGTLIEEIQGLENDNADKKTEMLITREEEASKIILEEMNKETTVSTETREIVSEKNEEGPYMNIHENPTKSTPCEAEPTENMYGMVVKPSSLEVEEATSTNSETTISAAEDAISLDNLSEGSNLLSTPSESVSKCIETTEAFSQNDQNVATMIDTSIVVEGSASDIPDKEEKAREHEEEHIETQAITAVEEVEHVNNDVPEAKILKESVKKLDEFNIQERSCESKDTQVKIPQHEETQVVLAAEQETTEESVMARTGNNNTSESFAEDQSQMNTDLKQEAKVCENETTESSNLEEFAKPGPEGLSSDQPSATETIVKETTVNLEERKRIPQNFERIPEASDTKNEEEGSREVDLRKAVEANTAIFLEDQSGSTEDKNSTEEQKPREFSEINGKPKEVEYGQYKESISKTEPSMSDLILDFERESFVEKKEPLESKVPLTVQVEKDAKEEEKYSADAEDEQVKEGSGSDAPVMVKASDDVDVKPSHKKSHNILSGVGSKVKHSIAKVKKVITGKSSSHKSSSPKQENGSATTA